MLRKLNYLNGKEIAKKKKILIILLVSVRRFISHFRQLLETRAVSVLNHLNISLPLVLTSHDIQTSGLSKKSKTKTCQNRKILSPEMDEF